MSASTIEKFITPLRHQAAIGAKGQLAIVDCQSKVRRLRFLARNLIWKL
jgi:hypothetical protein